MGFSPGRAKDCGGFPGKSEADPTDTFMGLLPKGVRFLRGKRFLICDRDTTFGHSRRFVYAAPRLVP